MRAANDADLDDGTCPNCGATVVYRGVGRRPVWCSTQCRNDASLKRLGARRAAVEVRIVEVARRRNSGDTSDVDDRDELPVPVASSGPSGSTKPPTPTPDQALRVLRNDPEAVGRLLSHLERRRADGSLNGPEWLPVRNALRLIAGALSTGVERPA